MTKKIVLGKCSEVDLSGPELMKIGHDSVVRIASKIGGAQIGHGSAFIYKQIINGGGDGISRLFLLTNLHNLKGALSAFPYSLHLAKSGQPEKNITIQMVIEFRGEEYEVATAHIAKGRLFTENEFFEDFAFVSIDVPVTDELSLFALPDDGDPEQGEDVFALGFPADTNLGISEGIISHVYDDKPPVPDYKWQVQHSILINGGNSGGPTVNRKGVAIGISTWKQLRSYGSGALVDGMNFSVNVHRLLDTARDTSTLDEVNLTGVFSRLAARAVEEAKFGN
jgi:S1-C subfamily serine protease